MTLTRRLVKGQALTSAEHDANIDHFEQNPNGIYIPKAQNVGIKIDETAPDWGWHDITSTMVLAGDASDPVFATYQGNIRQLQFQEGANVDIAFHIPHDYAMGTDIFIHAHWSHASGLVTSSTVTGNFEASYAKSFDQASFSALIVLNLVGVPASNIRYQHMLVEGQLSSASGVGGLLVTEDMEPDGMILCRMEMTASTLPVGVYPFLHEIDLHYQSTNVATKSKAPDFWT